MMKNKASVKAIAPPRKPPEGWPRFLKDILGQLDVGGSDPAFFTNADIAPEARFYVSDLMAQGLLSEEFAPSVACISCDGMTTIRRTGARGEMASALCPCCGAIFQTNDAEIRRWRADWNSLGSWLKDMAGTTGEMEDVSPMALFLGYLVRGQERFEVYLARSLTDSVSAQQAYSAISQSMNGSGIVLSLARNFLNPTNPRIAVVRLSDCLVISGRKFALAWPEHAFSGKDQAKQRAGLTRTQNDPRQKQKESLKAFVRSKITNVFANKYHHLIADDIIKKHTGQITYTDRLGKEQLLSKHLILGAVAEVMRENGLDDWISGKKLEA